MRPRRTEPGQRWGGLFLLGVPLLGFWGILAGLLRFVPDVGSIVGAVALAAAIDRGWSLVIYVALLFVIVEPLVGYAVEPMLYGHSTGLSPVSVIVAALFWTRIWGPIGLVLSMPLTLMLVLLGRHIPAFSMFDILLGDRPALSPAETFYQRALAGRPDASIEQAEDLLESRTLADYYDDVVVAGHAWLPPTSIAARWNDHRCERCAMRRSRCSRGWPIIAMPPPVNRRPRQWHPTV